MSAATWPTNFLSTPWTVIFVLSATMILMSFGIENETGWEKPRLKLRVDPWTAALKPNSFNLELLGETLAHALHHVVHETARKPMQRFHAA